MWLADFIFEYAELKADYFNQSFESILNDSLLGLTVVTIGLVIWIVILLVKDPNGVFEKKFTKNKVRKNGLHCSPFLFLMFELFIK